MNVSNNVHGLRVYCFLLKLSFLSSRFEPLLKKNPPSKLSFVHPSLQTNISIYHQTCKVSYVLAFLELFLIHFQKAIFTNFFEEFVNIKKYELYETVFQKYNQFFSKSRSVKLNYIIKKKTVYFFTHIITYTFTYTFFPFTDKSNTLRCPSTEGQGGKNAIIQYSKGGPRLFAPSLSSFVLTVRFKDYRAEIPPRDTAPYKMRTYPQELDVKANHTVLIVHRAIMFHSTQGYWLSMSRGFSAPVCV